MEKIKHKERIVSNEVVDYYSFSNNINVDDINKIIDTISAYNIETSNYHLSNTLEQPEHFFRVFPTLKDLYTYPLDDVYIEDFGVKCTYNDVINFSLNFNFPENQVITFTKDNINLEPLLMQIEENCKKKSR